MKHIKYLIVLICFTSCAHVIEFRSSHFLTPTVSDQQWGGSFSLSAATPSKVRVVDNISGNPPVVGNVVVNDDITISDALLLGKLGMDFNLSLFPSLEAYLTGSTYGLKWQFMNHAKYDHNWVGSLMVGLGGRSISDSIEQSGQPEEKVTSKVSTQKVGLSLGYAKSKSFTPYVSYVHEQHKVKTEVDNSHGHFGPYENEGQHDYATIGLSTKYDGILAAIEYNFIFLDWKDAEYKKHNTIGLLFGIQW